MPDIQIDSFSTLIAIIVLGLATSRLSSLIVIDDIFERVRHEIFLLSPPEDTGEDAGVPYIRMDRIPFRKRKKAGGDIIQLGPYDTSRKPGFWGRVISCIYCAGVWAAAFLIGLWLLAPSVAAILILLLAAAQVHEVVHSWARL